MRVILRADVDGLGRKGDICDVADGHFRNLLNPKGLAMKASDGAEAQAGAMRRATAMRDAASQAEAQEVATKFETAVVTVKAKAGEGGRLFGSVSTADIADAVEAQLGVVLDRRTLDLESPIKELGEVAVTCQLHAEVSFSVAVEVVEE